MRGLIQLLICVHIALVSASLPDGQVQSTLHQEMDPGPQQLSQPPLPYSCEQLSRVPAAERCAFVREQCESDSRLPYTEWYYCNVAPAGVAASFFFALFLAVLLPLLFTLLGDTAEIYFSPIMTHISQSIPKMRPRFAGVTFVAMGNGATDLSANISAIRNGDVLLSAGALTGAAMFVQCIVASEVMRASRGPVKCRGATLRDVGIYSVSILMVLAAFAHGKITYWFIVGALLLYLTYAVWVFVGDEWHERGRPEALTVWRSFRSSVEGRLSSRWGRQSEDLPWAMVDVAAGPGDEELSAPLVADRSTATAAAAGISSRPGSPRDGGSGGRQPQSSHPRHHLISAKAYQTMVWADLNPEEPGMARREEEGGEGAGGEGGDGLRRRRSRRRRQPSYGNRKERAGGAAAAASVELGAAGAVGGGGYRPPGPVPPGGFPASGPGASDPAGKATDSSSSTGGSQLVTLSSLDGSALAAPAPVDAPPTSSSSAATAPIRRPSPYTTGAPGAAFASAANGAAPTAYPARETDPWGDGSGSGSGSDYGSDSEEDVETAGLLAAQRRGPGAGRVGGGGGGGSAEDREAADGGGGSEGGEGDVISVTSSLQAGRGRWPARLWRKLRYELTVGTSAEWDDLPPLSLRRRWRTLTFPLLLPAYAAIRLTIPFVDPATYSRRWLLTTCVGAPLLFAVYIAPGSWVAAVAALTAGAALAAAVGYLTAGEEDALPDLDFGTSFAFGPAFFAVFGFVMGVIWIGSLASEAVGVISLMASLLRLPASVLGLTLLAWGNSLGDFFGNAAMARRGQPTMALTACFAGPLFNMLISMALGFASYFARRHVGSASVVLRPEVALGCVFLVLYNAAVAAAGIWNRGSLPKRFYVFARLWYGAYFASACALGLWVGQGD